MTGYSFHPLAESELLDAIEQIQAHPEASPAVRKGLRRKTLARFPYSLIYGTELDAIKILAVMHHRRRPAYWMGRK